MHWSLYYQRLIDFLFDKVVEEWMGKGQEKFVVVR